MARWEEITDELRRAISGEEFGPGMLLPKETELMARYGAGRETIRKAVAQLTAEGLLEPRRRRGTMVRQRPRRHRLTRSRTVYRDEIGYYFDLVAQPWRAIETPTVSRGPVPFDVAGLLEVQPGTEVVIRDRIMGNPGTGEPAQLATSYIPASLADALPVLAERDTGPGGIYDRMEDAGYGPVKWSELITASIPTPVEARRLRLPSGVALLRVIRLASSPDGRPLEVNDTRMDAERFAVGYTITRAASARFKGR
jgi:GntR family transcriptional regulator